jgi:hypothetical protein
MCARTIAAADTSAATIAAAHLCEGITVGGVSIAARMGEAHAGYGLLNMLGGQNCSQSNAAMCSVSGWNSRRHGICFCTVTLVVAQSSLELQMNKRTPATASRRARTPKPTAKAQRAKPAVVRSPKPGAQHLVEAIAAEAPAKARNKSRHPVPVVENPAAALQAVPVVENPPAALPAAPVVENSAAALAAARIVEKPPAAFQDAGKPAMTNDASNRGFDFSSAAANLQAYQAKLLELALANMQFAFELAQRLATIRSPLDIFGVAAEFTSKRIALLRKYA